MTETGTSRVLVQLDSGLSVDMPGEDSQGGPGLAEIARQVQAQVATDPDAEPTPFMAGTFAMYGTPQGGIVVVMDLPDGTPVGRPGVSRTYMPPAIVRVLDVISSGGSKMEILKAVGKALTSGGSKTKAIGT